MNCEDIKNKLENLKENDFDDFLMELTNLLVISKLIIKKFKTVNNGDRLSFHLGNYCLFKSYLSNLMNENDFNYYTNKSAVFLKNNKIISKLLRNMNKLVMMVAGNGNIDELLFLIDSIKLVENTFDSRDELYNDLLTSLECSLSGISVMLPIRDVSMEDRNKELEDRNVICKKLKKEKALN